MDEDIHTIEQFHGVYLLYCENLKYKGRTYIGYTVDPNRRIKQHNKGKKAGGAWKTSNKGPWKMVLIIHGFPNDISALRFEWAWQHPQNSRRLNHLSKKKNNEKVFDYLLRILSEMLLIGPWNRLPLTIRWLKPQYAKDFPPNKIPPFHMPICYGPVVCKKLSNNQRSPEKECENIEHNLNRCYCCNDFIKDKNQLKCLSPVCDLIAHFECLAKLFLEIGEYIPVSGNCPKCNIDTLWGDLIRKSLGCYKNLEQKPDDSDSDIYSDLSD